MEDIPIFGAVFLFGGIIQLTINFIVVKRLGLGILHPLAVFEIACPFGQSPDIGPLVEIHILFCFSFAAVYDYMYFQFLCSA